jgi:diguanylate cyclase (GGDEF)-like protein
LPIGVTLCLALKLNFQRATRYKENHHVVMFDIDYFKKVNDSYGNQIDDLTLQKVTEVIKQCLRDNIDIFGRLGSEEFCGLLPHILKIDAINIANRIRKDIKSTMVANKPPVTCSFGISHANQFGEFATAIHKATKPFTRPRKTLETTLSTALARGKKKSKS